MKSNVISRFETWCSNIKRGIVSKHAVRKNAKNVTHFIYSNFAISKHMKKKFSLLEFRSKELNFDPELKFPFELTLLFEYIDRALKRQRGQCVTFLSLHKRQDIN